MGIPMLKIRRPLGRLIFNMGIAIPGKTVFLIETAPRFTFATNVSISRHLVMCIYYLQSTSCAIMSNKPFPSSIKLTWDHQTPVYSLVNRTVALPLIMQTVEKAAYILHDVHARIVVVLWPWYCYKFRCLSYIASTPQKFGFLRPLLATVLNLIPAWISNHMPSKMWDDIIHSSPEFNG